MSDDVASGLTTEDWRERRPPALNVTRLSWDSAFRAAGLKPGDQIIAVQGRKLLPDMASDQLPGRNQEARFFHNAGLKAGDTLRLTVRRRCAPQGWTEFEAAAPLRSASIHRDAEGRTLVGAGGPPRLARDGFNEAWAPWLERRVFEWARQIDGTVWKGSTDTRQALARHLEAQPRIDYLAAHYPGPFSAAVLDDWTSVRDLLEGGRYELTSDDARYRDAEHEMVARISLRARTAWDRLVMGWATELVEPPGDIRMTGGMHEQLAGRLVVLPSASPQDWLVDVGQVHIGWHVNNGWLLTPLEQPALLRLWQAQARYRRDLSPRLSDDVAVIGRILPQPRLVVPKGAAAVVGLEIEPLSALMGDGAAVMFVDLTVSTHGTSAYEGEAEVPTHPEPLPPDDASPTEVMQALIRALQWRDFSTWRQLFADWRLMRDDNGMPYYYPYDPYPDANLQAHWEQSRRLVLSQVHAVRVAWADDPEEVVADDIPDLPRIERAVVELDHVGCFDGTYRAFNSPALHRQWVLHRRDGGPWRISTHQGI